LTIGGIGGHIAEAYASLQTNIAYARLNEPVKSLVFTSAMPGEGKTTTATNLALSLAQLGRRVLLIDADLRRGMVHGLFQSPREPGLTNVLQGGVSFDEARQAVQLDEGRTFHYLTTGKLPPYPVSVLESEDLRSFLRWARNEYDMVIIDSPPVNIITDAALLGVHADGVLLVARAGSTSTAALEFAMEQLGRVSARVLGVVLNGIDFKRDAIYDSAYTYYGYGPYTSNPTG
jgi:capsular exopolysaccharide synthesis family protein